MQEQTQTLQQGAERGTVFVDVRQELKTLDAERDRTGTNFCLDISQNSNTYGQTEISKVNKALLLQHPASEKPAAGGHDRHYFIVTDRGLKAVTARYPDPETVKRWEETGDPKLAQLQYAKKVERAMYAELKRCEKLPDARKHLQGIQYIVRDEKTKSGGTVETASLSVGPVGRPDHTIINGPPSEDNFIFINDQPPVGLYQLAVDASIRATAPQAASAA